MPRALLFTGFTMLAFAATMYAAPAPSTWASGEIERADNSSLVIKQGTHEMTFTLASAAKVTSGHKTLAAAELPRDVGRHVKVRYRMDGATKVADRVEITDSTASGQAKKS